ncbi:putative 1-acyl-sn-glycerol-3-phosphate acyltransferase [Fusarium oxysporum f. sp. albedinis]|nr:putative 1-acyl-sn-glycerol-3-phosphate acyltransferase [Fusarium oxysporum f. sp. albedinis]
MSDAEPVSDHLGYGGSILLSPFTGHSGYSAGNFTQSRRWLAAVTVSKWRILVDKVPRFHGVRGSSLMTFQGVSVNPAVNPFSKGKVKPHFKSRAKGPLLTNPPNIRDTRQECQS